MINQYNENPILTTTTRAAICVAITIVLTTIALSFITNSGLTNKIPYAHKLMNFPLLFQSPSEEEREKWNIMAKNAWEIGFKRCASRINAVTSRMFKQSADGRFSARTSFNENAPEQNLYSVEITRKSVLGGTVFSTLTVSPEPDCPTTYQETIIWGATCDKVEQVLAKNNKLKSLSGTMIGNVSLKEDAAGNRLYVMPIFNDSCVSVHKTFL